MSAVADTAARPQIGIGSRVKRVEDPKLLRGPATDVDDLDFPGMLHAAVLRSTLPHAEVRGIDTSKAEALDGVHAVITEADLAEMGVGDLPAVWIRPGQTNTSHPVLARGRVRHVGEAVAMVAADSRRLAEDAIELIEVSYEELPPVLDPVDALADDAPQLYPDVGNNICVHLETDSGDIEKGLADADVILEERMRIQRYSGIPIETRGVISMLEPAVRGGQKMRIYSSTQVIHHARDIIAQVLNWPQHSLHVIAPDVGGGFGPKDHAYAEEILAPVLTIKTGRPVKWIEDRQEHFISTVHAREQVIDVEIGARNDGTITGIRGRMVSGMGGHASNVGAGPVSLTQVMLPGAYRVPNYRAEAFGMMTNKVPSGAYRGFGMVQSTFVIERLMDMLAAKLDLDPAEIRRRNFVRPEDMPYETGTDLEYDSGDYAAALERALEWVDYDEWRRKQEEGRKAGRFIGIGICSYVEAAGFAPSPLLRELGFGISGCDAAIVKVDMQGKVSVHTGISSQGQGHQTVFAQIAAETLGVDFDDVVVVQGDTESTPYASAGAIASRGAAVCGPATLRASEKVRDKMSEIAAHHMEAAPEDIDFGGGKASVKGVPSKSMTMREIAREGLLGHDLPEGLTPGLEETIHYDPTGLTYPFATHIAVMEVDPDTGGAEFLRYVVVHDCGTLINPMVVEGQVHGGIGQGVGGALLEDFSYSESGQPLATSFMDYLLPGATDMPTLEVEHTETPSPNTPRGIKGMGEGGAIGPPAAIGNAIADALAPFDVKVTATPLSPNAIWQLIHAANGDRAA